MNANRNTKMQGNAIGISLILVVFILLCLITFGTLSLMLSDADNELSISSAENVVNYYEADMVAQEKLMDIDETLEYVYFEAANDDHYWMLLEEVFSVDSEVELTMEEDGVFLTFYTEVSDIEELVSKIEVCYPALDGYYRIESWNLESTSTLQ